MKTRDLLNFIFLSLMLSCEQGDVLKNFSVDQITYEDCHKKTVKSDLDEYVEYKTVDQSYLQINHFDVRFNCEPGKLLVDAEISNDTIVINETEETAGANCICPYDLSYRIGPLTYSTYTIQLQKSTRVQAQFSIDFNLTTSGSYHY